MRRIAVLTSGGDAPGMNAAIRAVVRTGIDKGMEVFGVQKGYDGLINGKFIRFDIRDVGGIIESGGTVLGSSRSEEFKTDGGLSKALTQLEKNKIDGLVVIGGNGSQIGSYTLSCKGFPVVGVASTIDNDLYGSDITIGVDTALNIAIEAIDRLKVTASSHNRAFLLEVMGRNCGYLALMAGIAGGAEIVVIPEFETEPESVAAELQKAYERGKPHAIAVVAEGAHYNAEKMASYFKENHERVGFDLRITALGYVQRGGIPTAFDRLLGSQLGNAATDCLKAGNTGVLAGQIKNEIAFTPLEVVVNNKKPLDLSLLKLANILAK
jgi:6-phosphofructokinase 1